MFKKMPRKIIFLLSFLLLIVLFGVTMLIIELIPEPLPVLTAVEDTIETNEDQSVTIKVLENDIDVDTTTLTIEDFSTPLHGRLIKMTSGLRYIPNVNYYGEDTFTYTVKNSTGETAEGTVTITVKSVNDAPNANNDFYTTTINTPFTIDVLYNDTDIEAEDITIQSFYDLPNHGTATIEDGYIRYTPNEGFLGVDEFTYRISDSSGATDTATVTISVISN